MSLSQPDMARLWGEAGLGTCPGLCQTFDRRMINGVLTPSTGVMYLSGIWLPQGMTVTSIVLYSSGGVTTNAHVWAALYQIQTGALAASPAALMAQSTDDVTGTDFAANTKITRTLAAAQVTPYTGLYYIAWMQSASTPNTLAAVACPASSIANSDVPIMSASSTGSLTTTAPALAGRFGAPEPAPGLRSSETIAPSRI